MFGVLTFPVDKEGRRLYGLPGRILCRNRAEAEELAVALRMVDGRYAEPYLLVRSERKTVWLSFDEVRMSYEMLQEDDVDRIEHVVHE